MKIMEKNSNFRRSDFRHPTQKILKKYCMSILSSFVLLSGGGLEHFVLFGGLPV